MHDLKASSISAIVHLMFASASAPPLCENNHQQLFSCKQQCQLNLTNEVIFRLNNMHEQRM
jgi:hypothetical protein